MDDSATGGSVYGSDIFHRLGWYVKVSLAACVELISQQEVVVRDLPGRRFVYSDMGKCSVPSVEMKRVSFRFPCIKHEQPISPPQNYKL